MRPAVHRTIIVVDVEGFGSPNRTNPDKMIVRRGLYRALEMAFRKVDVPWEGCHRTDCGDGVFILVPAEVSKGIFVETLPFALLDALRKHNRGRREQECIRLRMALHAGEIHHDDHGVAGAAITLAFRLVNARPLRNALVESSSQLALITSRWFFDEVVRHSSIVDIASYRQVQVKVKETRTKGWIFVPGSTARVLEASMVGRGSA